jgi:integrase/recombinase XerD
MVSPDIPSPDHEPGSGERVQLVPIPSPQRLPFPSSGELTNKDLRGRFLEARHAWLTKSPSLDTRQNYARDLQQFLDFVEVPPDHLERLVSIVPGQVAAWRDRLREQGLTNSSIRRKMTALRSLFSYLQSYGYAGANPAHSDFVAAPAVPRDGKTVGLAPESCRRLLDAPDPKTPVGIRDRALLAVLAYTGCRVGELVRLRVGSYKTHGGHRILEIFGKGGKERRVPLHPESFERLDAWLETAGIRWDLRGALFRPVQSSRGQGYDGFANRPMSRRALQFLIAGLVKTLGLDPAVTVHSLRVTALTTARERGCDVIDLQDFAGHSDPRTTLTYIRNRDRLSKSPAYVLRY